MFTRKELTEWTSALRANPEQQLTRQLANSDYTMFCCLGKLCEVRGIRRIGGGYYIDGDKEERSRLPITLAKELTGDRRNQVVNFSWFGMPNLKGIYTAAGANDRGCTWIEIADHFDKYYPCSDEQPPQGLD